MGADQILWSGMAGVTGALRQRPGRKTFWPADKAQFTALTGKAGDAAYPFLTSLPDGVMVAQATLTRLVMVRIHVGQPLKPHLNETKLGEDVRRWAGEGDERDVAGIAEVFHPSWRRV